MGVAAQRKARGDEHNECGGLKRGGNELCPAAPANAAPLQQEKSADDADGNQRFMPCESGEKIAAILCNDNRDSGGCAAGRKPVAPSDNKARIFSDSAARKIVLAAAAGN